MDLLMNGLLMAATLFAGGYCWVLGRRVQDLKSLDRGLGGSIVTLTRQIELARMTLDEARSTSKETRQDLAQLIGKADGAANQLKMLIAAAPVYPPAPVAPVAPVVAPVVTPRQEAPAARPVVLTEMPDLAEMMRAAEPIAKPRSEPMVAAPEAPPEPAGPGAVPAATAMNLAEVPKPRALAPIENPLRRAKGIAKAPAGGAASEDAILEALSALAGGRR